MRPLWSWMPHGAPACAGSTAPEGNIGSVPVAGDAAPVRDDAFPERLYFGRGVAQPGQDPLGLRGAVQVVVGP